MAQPVTLRVLTYRFESGWCSQCLEHNFAAVGNTNEEALSELERIIAVYLLSCQEHGIEPFVEIEPAPTLYWKMFEDSNTKTVREPTFQIFHRILPAYRLEQRMEVLAAP